MININLVPLDSCSGCTACGSICKKGAISFKQDEEGFYKPIVDSYICTNCGVCLSKCPVVNEEQRDNYATPVCYSGWHSDKEILEKSASGGAFSALAQNILSLNGVVYGAAYTSTFEVMHRRVNCLDDLDNIRGSKYPQSFINETFSLALEDLNNGVMVLFSGTPCQIAGLYSILGKKKYDNLVTCEIICHGVMSPLVFKSYLEYLQFKYNDVVIHVNLRDKKSKTECWENYYTTVFLSKHIHSESHRKNPLMFGFLSDMYLRKSCHDCKFAKLPRQADVTIGDFWCHNPSDYPKDFNKDGTSLILINNYKGWNIFNQCFTLWQGGAALLSTAVKYNPNILGSTSQLTNDEKLNKRALIFKLIQEKKNAKVFESVLKRPSRLHSKLQNIKVKIYHYLKCGCNL